MTIEQARAAIGRRVIYRSGYAGSADAPPEFGVITGVNDWVVFVRYGSAVQSAATDPRDLEVEQ